MTFVELKRKTENQKIEKIFEHSLLGEAKRLEARKAVLLKNSVNKKTLKQLYVRYTFDSKAHFSLVKYLDFQLFPQYINPVASNALLNSNIESALK